MRCKSWSKLKMMLVCLKNVSTQIINLVLVSWNRARGFRVKLSVRGDKMHAQTAAAGGGMLRSC